MYICPAVVGLFLLRSWHPLGPKNWFNFENWAKDHEVVYLFIYLFLAASGLSCLTRDHLLWCVGSFVVARGLLSSCGLRVLSLAVAHGLQGAWSL